MKTILVPTDFSRIADAALDVAVSIASRVKGKVNLLRYFSAVKSRLTIVSE
jgi:nucleotide-binding universal stress UspA family protein